MTKSVVLIPCGVTFVNCVITFKTFVQSLESLNLNPESLSCLVYIEVDLVVLVPW